MIFSFINNGQYIHYHIDSTDFQITLRNTYFYKETSLSIELRNPYEYKIKTARRLLNSLRSPSFNIKSRKNNEHEKSLGNGL